MYPINLCTLALLIKYFNMANEEAVIAEAATPQDVVAEAVIGVEISEKPTVEVVALADGTKAIKTTVVSTKVNIRPKVELEKERDLLIRSRDGLQDVIDKLQAQIDLVPVK